MRIKLTLLTILVSVFLVNCGSIKPDIKYMGDCIEDVNSSFIITGIGYLEDRTDAISITLYRKVNYDENKFYTIFKNIIDCRGSNYQNVQEINITGVNIYPFYSITRNKIDYSGYITISLTLKPDVISTITKIDIVDIEDYIFMSINDGTIPIMFFNPGDVPYIIRDDWEYHVDDAIKDYIENSK